MYGGGFADDLAVGADAKHERHAADAVLLCTGGYGNVFYLSTNAKGCNTTAIWRAHKHGAGFGNPHVATAFITDALTLLSNAWSDRSSFTSPENPAGRAAATTWYRYAVIAGKGQSFPRPTAWAWASR